MAGRLLIRHLCAAQLPIAWRDLCFRRTAEGKPYLAQPDYFADENTPSEGKEGAGDLLPASSPLASSTLASSSSAPSAPSASSPAPLYNFNLSHHGDWLVVGSHASFLIGVDVTKYDLPRNYTLNEEYFDLMVDVFTPHEWASIKGAPDEHTQLMQFYRHWTMKEAYIKAVGVGLQHELQRIEFRHPTGDIWSPHPAVFVDGEALKGWAFYVDRLDDTHCTTVALGPWAQAGDAFKRTAPPAAVEAAPADATALLLGLAGEGGGSGEVGAGGEGGGEGCGKEDKREQQEQHEQHEQQPQPQPQPHGGATDSSPLAQYGTFTQLTMVDLLTHAPLSDAEKAEYTGSAANAVAGVTGGKMKPES